MKAYVRKRTYASGSVAWLLAKEVGDGADRKRTYDTFTTETEANTARDSFLGEVADGGFFRESEMPLSDFLDEWLEQIEAELAPNTVARYKTSIENQADRTSGVTGSVT